MDPATLSLMAATLAAKALEKAVETATENGVDGATQGLRKLIAWVRKHFRGAKPLEVLEAAPDSPRATAALGSAIEQLVRNDPKAAEELAELVARANGMLANPNIQVGTMLASSGGIAANIVQGGITMNPPPNGTLDSSHPTKGFEQTP